MDESRIVRDLLDANLRLTGQFLELARLAIGAPPVVERQVSTYVEQAQTQPPEFHFSSADDWEDIPTLVKESDHEEQAVRTLEIPRRQPDTEDEPLPLHMTEEEEDLRYRVAMGHEEAPAALTDLLHKLRLPSGDIEFTTA